MAHDKDGFDSHKRWGNSGIKGHGANSPAMMEARKGFDAKKKVLASKHKWEKDPDMKKYGHSNIGRPKQKSGGVSAKAVEAYHQSEAFKRSHH